MNELQTSIFSKKLLKDQTIFITGSSSGIGKETAQLLKKLGARLILISRSKERLLSIKEFQDPKNVVCLEMDLSQNHADLKIFDNLPTKWLPLTGVFHCAGQEILKPLPLVSIKEYEKLSALSLHSVFLFSKAATKSKYFADGSSLVFMSSAASIIGTPGMSQYASIKSAINGASLSIAAELAFRKIRVNTILAGAIETPMHKRLTSKLSEKSLDEYRKKHLLGFGKPIDVANMVVYLLSPASKWITGCSFNVDGGYSSFK
tara:strand:+ start:867 stop:1649 length:783 start_codon:yes stop_codon:yes gene_type:complete